MPGSSSPLKPEPKSARPRTRLPAPEKRKTKMLVMKNTSVRGRPGSRQGPGSDVKRIGPLKAKAPPPHRLKVVRENLKSRKSALHSSPRHGNELSRFEGSAGSYAAKRKRSSSSRSKRAASD